MTLSKDKDYEHSNTAGNGPAKRMEGGDETDDIEINNPDTPLKKALKKEHTQIDTPELQYRKPK